MPTAAVIKFVTAAVGRLAAIHKADVGYGPTYRAAQNTQDNKYIV